jgi:acetylornithine deacetylase/succinyl-diaminopimelate desuccinylase-like protein
MGKDRPAVNWDEVTVEATDILSRYIAVDTSNPPGREELAASFLADILRREGIESRTFDAGEGRASLSARLPGDGSKKALILLNHTDVVPVEAAYWQEEPFAGVVKDGTIWGRGALDMKGMAVMELMSFLLCKRLRLPLKRDLVFLAVADEEVGGLFGIEWLDKNHPEALEAEYVINEGGYGFTQFLGVQRHVFTCAIGEKGPLWLQLKVEGAAGHGSLPHADNCVERLVRALNKIQQWERPITVIPELAPLLQRLHGEGYLAEEPTPASLGQLAETNLLVKAILTNTIANTVFQAGIKHNVIPATAQASLDCRLLPGQSPEEFTAQVREVIDDPKVEVQQVYHSSTPASPVQTELFDIVEDVVRETREEALVLPIISPGFTDSRVFRARGTVAYGFLPVLLELQEAATVHGHNERISIENLRGGTQILFETTRRLCT